MHAYINLSTVGLSTTGARASSARYSPGLDIWSCQREKVNWLCLSVALTPKSISASHLQPITLRLLDIKPTVCHISIMYEVCYSILIGHWNYKQLSLFIVSLIIHPPGDLYFLLCHVNFTLLVVGQTVYSLQKNSDFVEAEWCIYVC